MKKYILLIIVVVLASMSQIIVANPWQGTPPQIITFFNSLSNLTNNTYLFSMTDDNELGLVACNDTSILRYNNTFGGWQCQGLNITQSATDCSVTGSCLNVTYMDYNNVGELNVSGLIEAENIFARNNVTAGNNIHSWNSTFVNERLGVGTLTPTAKLTVESSSGDTFNLTNSGIGIWGNGTCIIIGNISQGMEEC